jgi:hypothetical protein
MGSIDFHIATLPGGQAYPAAEDASSSQAQPARPVLPASEAPAVFPPGSQQDRVSLSGTLPPQPRQLETQSNGNVQPAAFTPLAQEITFPPGQSTADVFTTSTFPPAATEAGQNSVSGVATTSASKSGSANAIATFSARTGEAKSPGAAAAANAAVSASPTGVSSTAPARQTLQQLDRELQRLGIDPQSLSLISRDGMLNSINEPGHCDKSSRTCDPLRIRRSQPLRQALLNRSKIRPPAIRNPPAARTRMLRIKAPRQRSRMRPQ